MEVRSSHPLLSVANAGFAPAARARLIGSILVLVPCTEILMVWLTGTARLHALDVGFTAASALFGIYFWHVGARWPLWSFQALAVVTALMIAWSMWVKGPEPGAVDIAAEFGLAIVGTYLTLPLRQAAINHVFVVVSHLTVLLLVFHDPRLVIAKAGVAVVSFTAMGAMVGVLRRAIEAAMGDLTGMARTDSLTFLSNRAGFMEAATQRLAALGHRRARLYLVDLDKFKEVNDQLGHHYGDELIGLVGQRLRELTRGQDLVGRLGGDEFAILAVEDSALPVLPGRISAGFANTFLVEGIELYVEASVGVAEYPLHGADVETLMRHADAAMYEAKNSSSGHAVYEPGTGQRRSRRLDVLGELHEAFDRRELVLHYQPQLSLTTGSVQRVEALVRWMHPQRGLLGPAEFLPAAEYSGLIHPLTRLVLREALLQHSRWKGEGITLDVAVNASARNLLDRTFPDAVEAILAETGVDGGHLTVEVTESALIAESLRVRGVLEQLRGLGVRVSVDDFGTGYSSLTTLNQLPLDELKLDRSFVSNLAPGSRSLAIVRNVITMGHDLGLPVVAEGIETSEVLADVQTLLCDEAQGYLIARPMPADQLSAWLYDLEERPLLDAAC